MMNTNASRANPMRDCLGLDVDEIVNSKMTKNEAKYPEEKEKGSAAKYSEL